MRSMSKISLLFQHNEMQRGPGKVAENLIKGLIKLGHEVSINK